MSWRYSVLEHDEVWVDEYDSVTDCDECGKEIDLDDGEGQVDGDYAFCEPCYDEFYPVRAIAGLHGKGN